MKARYYLLTVFLVSFFSMWAISYYCLTSLGFIS